MNKICFILISTLFVNFVFGKPKTYSDRMYVKWVDEVLYIGAKYDDHNDILIHFNKCLNNNLIEFSKVGIAANENDQPSGNITRVADKYINVAYSDNIGPLNVGGYFCGANHCYNEDYTAKVKTAKSERFACYADGHLIDTDQMTECTEVNVKVTNIIYNPMVPTYNSEKTKVLSLDSILCYEDVDYKITRGNISVTLEHRFVNTKEVVIKTYYGMQSMAEANEVYFPDGSTTDFVKKAPGINNIKSLYPNLSTWVQRDSARSWYEACWMNNKYELGKREHISESDNMAFTSGNKVYQRIINSQVVKNGDRNKWSGCYTWFLPYVDNKEILCYEAKYNGKNYIIIDIKKAVNAMVELPKNYLNRAYSIWQLDGSISINKHISNKGIHVKSTGAGVAVISFS